MKINLVNENYESDYLKNLLLFRGVNDFAEFLDPTEKSLNSYELFDNINEAIELYQSVLDNPNSKILLVVDSDVDGFTSGAIIYNYTKEIAPEQYIDYILHEHKEHGLQDHYQNIIDGEIYYDLVILPDSSSNDYDFHEALKEINTKCLILDHHEIDENQKISENAIIVNNQLSANYPNKELTGAGVAWQFCRAHGEKYDNYQWQNLMDLAATGICGDMGSVLNLENRYIMMTGFRRIRNYFLEKAIEKQSFSMNGEVNPTTVAFYIVPMMNAMIRVGTQPEKERLFIGLTDGHRQIESNKRGAKGTFEEAAIESLRECTNAKAKQTRITDQMVDKLEQKIFKYNLLDNKILFVRLEDEDDFPSEINGLIAMKLAAKYKHPTLVGRLGADGYDKGSIRNVSDCALADLKAFLNDSGYFDYVQGHANAAGFSILDKDLKDFHDYANGELSDIDFNEGSYDVNFIREANSKDLNTMVMELARYPEMWGKENPEPKIAINNINITSQDIQIMGKANDTVKIIKNNMTYIKFKAFDMIQELRQFDDIKLNIVGIAKINEWNGNRTPQIFIEDYEVIDNRYEF